MHYKPIEALIVFCLICLGHAGAYATEIQTSSLNGSSNLGGAYSSTSEKLIGAECMTGTHANSGISIARFDLTQALSEKEASKLLGLEAGGRARFGAVEASAFAKFLKNSVSTSQSTSAIWMSEYVLPRVRLLEPQLNEIGKGVQLKDDRFSETCGDEYVAEIAYGARLFFSIRIEFASKEEKERFEAKFSISGPLAGLNGSMEQATREFSRDTKVTFSAIQIGGDVNKVTGVLGQTAVEQDQFVKCTLGGFEMCAHVVASAVRYASDLENGFPSQLSQKAFGGTPLSYKTVKYSAAGIYNNDSSVLLSDAISNRKKLHENFEQQLKLEGKLLDIKSAVFDITSIEKIDNSLKLVANNIDNIVAASNVCYDNVQRCAEMVDGLKLQAVDSDLFEIPPIAAASFRAFGSSTGLASRSDSIKFMTTCQRYENDDLLEANEGCADENGSVSAVIYIEGEGLKSADLYFENQILQTFPLRLSRDSFQQKFTPKGSFLVIESNKGNPGWIDIDLTKHRHTLWSDKPYYVADGVFYILVSDVFGRTRRFDIEYENWVRLELSDKTSKQFWSETTRRNRWWDLESDGVSVAGQGNWTLNRTENEELPTR
jgi:hypothetical protein